MSSRRLNRATLGRQMLLGREPLPAVDAVRRVVAVQAQSPPSPYIALWNRVAGFDPAEADAAFASHAVVKATLMRITLHAVVAEDHPPFRAAMLGTLRAAGLNDRRFTSTGLTPADADALIARVVEHADRPRTRDEIETVIAERLGAPPAAGVWRAVRMCAPLVHAPTGGPWSFGTQPAFVAAPECDLIHDHDDAVQHLLVRYLEAFGPATWRDFAQFAMLRRPTVQPALEALAGRLSTLEGPDGAELLDVPGAPMPAEDVPAPPRLMAMWDSVLLAYADRSRIIPEEYRSLVVRRNGDVLPTVLVDGYVAGVWRLAGGGIEVTAFHPLPGDTWSGIVEEAEAMLGWLSMRDPGVYRRYDHWWSGLPAAETVRVPG